MINVGPKVVYFGFSGLISSLTRHKELLGQEKQSNVLGEVRQLIPSQRNLKKKKQTNLRGTR